LLANFEEIKCYIFIPISEADNLGEMSHVPGEVSIRFPELQPGHRKISSAELPNVREYLQFDLKGQCHEIFNFRLFH
jgi:hypothetical protein